MYSTEGLFKMKTLHKEMKISENTISTEYEANLSSKLSQKDLDKSEIYIRISWLNSPSFRRTATILIP